MIEFEKWMNKEKAKIAECLRRCGRLNEEIPDMPGISDPESLCEQFYNSFGQPINVWVTGFPKDGIDWEAVEKELKAFADEVSAEWIQRKRAQDRADAMD
ncbi:hypothetical protein QUB05_21080 [Microcoleus sp. F10-C6]|uniref:hypothetical protein n=1 Tax=unclassified Microcoleus TaxID=2642155 RepID=UPI002FD0BB2A